MGFSPGLVELGFRISWRFHAIDTPPFHGTLHGWETVGISISTPLPNPPGNTGVMVLIAFLAHSAKVTNKKIIPIQPK